MGLLDSISGALQGALGQAESQALPGILSQILGRTNLGSIGGLLATLQQSGLGPQVASWLGNGANLPINADQLRTALGDERLQQIARAAGVPVDQLLAALTHHLPGAVDRMSPNGKLQENPAPGEESDAAEPGSAGSIEDQAGLNNIK